MIDHNGGPFVIYLYLRWCITYLNDLHVGTEPGWETKVQDPVESGTQKHHNISLQQSSTQRKTDISDNKITEK